MDNYIFILGRDPELSLLEIVSYFNLREIKYKLIEHSKIAAVFELPSLLNFKKIIKDLGGTVKICKINDDLEDIYQRKNNKFRYYISNYSNRDISNLREHLKYIFKKQKLKALYKRPPQNILMPNEVFSNKILTENLEIVLYKNYIAVTIACSNPVEYEKRDTSRPRRDYLKTISIRLAKILINLSQPKKSLLDPFCGYGILLQEALLNDLDVIGIDIDKKSIEATKENLEWLKHNYSVKGSYILYNLDSKLLSKKVTKIDSVATEPYLGPYLKGLPTESEARKTIRDLENLYFDVLKELKKVKPKTIVIIVPRFKTKSNTIIKMDFSSIIKKIGFESYSPLSEIKTPVVYSTGFIDREVWILK